MWKPFSRRRAYDHPAESPRARQIQRALDEDSSSEILEAAFDRADQDNAGIRFAPQLRQGNGIFGLFGQGRRPSLRQQLKEEGYDGD
jgi:hypothetical protein